MLDRIAVDVELQSAPISVLTGSDKLDKACNAELTSLLASLATATGKTVEAVVHHHAPQHIGLGTKTALKLALISAYHRLVGLADNRTAQQRLSGRGGASGIGLHGFFDGGVLWDAGKPADSIGHILPSGAGPGPSAPVLMMRQPFPRTWQVGLCLTSAPLSHGADERHFFETNAPIARSDALETMALLYHGVLPAFRTESINLLASSLKAICATGFKRLEIERCGNSVGSLLGDLHGKGYAAGMSSMGPLIYAIFDGDDVRAAGEIEAICTARGATWLGAHRGLNRGARIRRVATA